jgi:hypothetical protein
MMVLRTGYEGNDVDDEALADAAAELRGFSTPLLGRVMLPPTWANIVEHAADRPDYWDGLLKPHGVPTSTGLDQQRDRAGSSCPRRLSKVDPP